MLPGCQKAKKVAQALDQAIETFEAIDSLGAEDVSEILNGLKEIRGQHYP